MKLSLFTTLLALTSIMITFGSSGVRGLQAENTAAASVAAPSVKIAGVSTLLKILNSATAFTNSTFDIITIDSFFESITSQGVEIQGKVTLSNDNHESVTGIITGIWDTADNKIIFKATKYEIATEEESDSENGDDGQIVTNSSTNTTNEDAYTSIDISTAESDAQVSAAFDWGVQALIAKGERQNKIPISDYVVTEWISASYLNQSNGVSYKFVAELLGSNYVHVETNMTVVYNSSDQSYRLNGYYYKATNITEGSLPNNFTDVDNNSNSTNSTDAGNSTDVNNNSTDVNNNSTDVNNNSTDVSNNSTDISNNSTDVNNNSTDSNNSTVVNNNSTDINNNGTNSTNSTNATIPAGVPANYTYISPADLANNTVASGAFDFGVDTLIQKGIAQYKIPAASPDYNVTNLFMSAYKNTSSGANYIFYTNLTNALKYKVDANMTITYKASTQTYALASYSFHSYNYPSSAIVIPQNNTNATNSTGNATNSTSSSNNSSSVANSTNNASNSTNNATSNVSAPSNTTVSGNSTVVSNSTGNATQPVSNSTTNSTDSVTSPANSTNSTNSTASSNTTTSANQTTSDGYTIMTAAQLANDSIAQGALQNGTNTLIQTGISQNKIPAANANYTINNITLAAYKKIVLGTYYKFQVNMTNADSVHVDANITVLYRYSTKAYSLNGYSFRSYNYSSSALNNNNSSTNNTVSLDPPIYDDGNGSGNNVTLIIEPDNTSGAR